MVANDPAKAKQLGIPQSVGQEFVSADKGKKFGTGGQQTRADLQKVNKPETRQGKTELFSKGGQMKEAKAMAKKEISFMEKKGAPKSMIKHEKAEYGMKKGGATKKMAKGGAVGPFKKVADGIAERGKTRAQQMCMGGKAKAKK
mgnify:CR=1 FL=1